MIGLPDTEIFALVRHGYMAAQTAWQIDHPNDPITITPRQAGPWTPVQYHLQGEALEEALLRAGERRRRLFRLTDWASGATALLIVLYVGIALSTSWYGVRRFLPTAPHALAFSEIAPATGPKSAAIMANPMLVEVYNSLVEEGQAEPGAQFAIVSSESARIGTATSDRPAVPFSIRIARSPPHEEISGHLFRGRNEGGRAYYEYLASGRFNEPVTVPRMEADQWLLFLGRTRVRSGQEPTNHRFKVEVFP